MKWNAMLCHYFVQTLLCVLLLILEVDSIGEVIWAVNCGGESHTDVHGIRYQKDAHKLGIPSDYGKSLLIQRVHPQDQILYQTERYHVQNFAYDVPVSKDGNYVLVLKFSEVWFTQPDQKVFDVVLNGHHTVVENLDIFGKVGRGVAHDEVVAFNVKNSKLHVNGETSSFEGKLTVEFVKLNKDNPKINAFYVMRGTLDDVPELPQVPGFEQPPREAPEEDEEEDLDDELRKSKRKRAPSAPKVQDPYAADDTSSMMLPVVLAIGAFIPLVFCLCKL